MKQRALVMSDTHGEGDGLRYLLDEAWKQTGNVPIDAYIHCGDGVGDLERQMDYIRARDPGAMFCMVRGNCDFGEDSVPGMAVIRLGGARIFVTHGHYYHVKSGLTALGYAAEENGCAIALYGHTHIPSMDIGRVLLVNAGCTADRRMALLTVEDGVPHVDLLRLNV